MKYVCPDCQKELKNKSSLDRHRAKFHAPANAPDTAPDINPEPLELDITPDTDSQYECNDCHTPVTKGQETCPGCGELLVWEGID